MLRLKRRTTTYTWQDGPTEKHPLGHGKIVDLSERQYLIPKDEDIDFKGLIFKDMIISDFDLSKKDLTSCVFENCTLVNVNFNHANH